MDRKNGTAIGRDVQWQRDLPPDLQVRQRAPQFSNAGIGDPYIVEIKLLQTAEPSEVF